MAASQQLRRTWPQRLTFAFVILCAVACFGAAGALATGQWIVGQRQLVEIADPGAAIVEPAAEPNAIILPGATTTVPPAPGETVPPVPIVEPDAANFLIVGADNGDCAGDDTPTIGERTELGERSDTIMIWRANPETDQLAVLSLPRDLYVDIAGSSKARINTAYRQNDPSLLIDTILLNFGVPVDHYVQVDFCAFKELVGGVGGVEVPFEFPARDVASGLSIPEAGCINLDPDTALAYVRSRKYQYEDPAGSGRWRTDGTSDFGRISRQQDFVRRLVAKVIDEGLYSPSVLTSIIETNREYLVTDAGLTLQRMLDFANTLRTLDPSEITTYRIESSPEVIADGSQVERPRIRGENMQAILAVFRGEAMLTDAPDQQFETTERAATVTTTTPGTTTPSTTTTLADDDTAPPTSAPAAATATTPPTAETTVASTTLPAVQAEENVVGVAPSRTATCG